MWLSVVRARTPEESVAARQRAVLLTSPHCAIVEFIDADNGTVRIPPGFEDAVDNKCPAAPYGRSWEPHQGSPVLGDATNSSKRRCGQPPLSATPGARRTPGCIRSAVADNNHLRRRSCPRRLKTDPALEPARPKGVKIQPALTAPSRSAKAGVAAGEHGPVVPAPPLWRAHDVTSRGVARTSG
jgi:hypothetical protein